MASCNRKTIVPSANPVIHSLSVYQSVAGTYCNVLVTGRNFFYGNNTYIQFGNIRVSAVFYSSFQVSFLVPLQYGAGTYSVNAVNVANVNNRISGMGNPGTLNSSNTVSFTLE